jgi:hypothetical protein
MWVCDEKKIEIADKFQMDLKNVDSNDRNIPERDSKSMQFFLLENC